MNIVFEALKNSILITGLVMIMMLLIEYINIHSHGSSFKKLQSSPIKQVIFATLLGLVPGCVGGFAVVSLFTHNLLSFGALVAMMISSSGDEAFIMLAMIPKTAIILFCALLVLGVGVGIAVDKIFKKTPRPFEPEHYEIHEDCDKPVSHPVFGSSITENLKKISKERLLIMTGIAIFILAVVFGLLEHDHIGAEVHDHATGSFNIFSERWINLVFAGVSLITLFLTVRANEHFIKDHLWNHVVKKHLKSIFLWTFGALIVIQFGLQFLDIEHWIKENVIVMILLAVAIGLIPESGPHMVFITLFAGGFVPFSVLFASSIVQDGHTTLPLLAESKSSFFKAKLINMIVGLAVGLLLHFVGL